ncbi:MAG: ATP-binding cassette domain-containing protein [Gemmatimonadaceae bacterium]|nr:ATP-binding cassette domain-containing protein [Gemmatimonadaceae bacterium]
MSDEARSAAVRQAIRRELAGDRVEAAPDGALAAAPEPPVIELSHVWLAFEQPVLEDVSLTVRRGETLVVVGESGTGKSTILRLILRLLVPDRGEVCIDGERINDLSFEAALHIRRKIGMVFQSAALFDSMTVFDNVAYPLREQRTLTDDQIEARVRETLTLVDLDPDQVMHQLPAELSGGMRKRVGIARGVVADPEIMLYDEPTSGLDPLTTGTITRLIMKLQHELGVTSVVVSHDLRATFRMATRVAVLADHHVVFLGTPEEMTASDDPYLRDFLGGL